MGFEHQTIQENKRHSANFDKLNMLLEFFSSNKYNLMIAKNPITIYFAANELPMDKLK